MTRLLIVDDSALMRRLLGEIFASDGGFEIETARSGEEAIARLHAFAPDVITLDIHMPGMDGLACLDRIMLERPCPVVMVSSLTEEGADETLEAMGLGAVDFIAKPRGPVSLEMETIAPALIDKVRAAARARVSRTARLAERVRLRSGLGEVRKPAARQPARGKAAARAHAPLNADGLVLVGTSTGGPAALDVVIGSLPADFPWPVLVAQHMPASFTGALARRLDRQCEIAVVEVAGPMPLLPGQVHIGRGDADLLVTRRGETLYALPAPSSPDFHWHPSVDRMVDSALDHVAPANLVGVLMTGMGSDGAAALTRLHERGGYVIAEAETTAIIWGMPSALVKAGGADAQLPLDEIAGALQSVIAG